jgi:hypothetical protein
VDRVQNWEAPGKYPELKELYRKNGFVFLKRDVPPPAAPAPALAAPVPPVPAKPSAIHKH